MADEGSPLHTIRVARRTRFVIVDARSINDRRLSYKARGLLAWLLDKPESWNVSAEAIARSGPDGRSAILSGLRELREAGYIVTVRQQNDRGLWTTLSTVYEHPDAVAKPLVAPKAENRTPDAQPECGFPTSDNRTPSNQDDLDKTPLTPVPEPDSSTAEREERIIRGAADLRVRQAMEAGGLHSPGRFRETVLADLRSRDTVERIARWTRDYPDAPESVLSAVLADGSTTSLRYYASVDLDADLYAEQDAAAETPSTINKARLTLISSVGGATGSDA